MPISVRPNPCLQKAKLAEASKDDEKSRRLSGKAYFLAQQQAGLGDVEEPALSDDDAEDFQGPAGASRERNAEEDEDEEDGDYDPDEDDVDFEDDEDDEDDMLDEYLSKKK